MATKGSGDRVAARPARAKVIALLLLCLAGPVPSHAACTSPLPTESLRALDDRIDADPAGVNEEVQRRLRDAGRLDALQGAALYAVSAGAFNLLDDDEHAREAAARSHERLQQVPDGAPRRAIEFRLALIEADAPRNQTDLADGVDRLSMVERTLPVLSLDRACLLIVRSRLNMQLLRDDEATADGIESYRITTALHSPAAGAEAAYQLAATYLRAGLLEDAVELADQAAAYQRAMKMFAPLSNALYIKADALELLHRYDEALAAISEARTLNTSLHQTIDVAFDDQKECRILLGSRQLDAAERSCGAARQVLAAAGRRDIVGVIDGNLATIAMLRGRPAEAIVRLDRVLSSDVDRVPATNLPELYRHRADALDRVGRFKDALRDLQEASRLTEAAERQHRGLAAARIKERFTAESITAEKNAVEAQMQMERYQADLRQRQWRFMLALAVVLGLLLVTVAVLMWKRARQERALRKAGETLDAQAHVLSTVREGVLLVDDHCSIRYANQSAVRLLGRPRDALVGLPAAGVGLSVPNPRAGRIGSVEDTESGPGELQLAGSAGLPRTVIVTTSIVSLHSGPLTVCILQDVTELRSLERELSSLASRERNQQGSDVHEGLAQDLAGIALCLRALAGRVPAQTAELELVIQHVNQVLDRSRTLARVLAPVQVARGSLAAALERRAAEIGAARGIRIDCRFERNLPRLSFVKGDQLYRIVDECLKVAAMDPNCGDIALEMRSLDTQLVLTVLSDGGQDLDRPPANARARATIQYLARAIGGSARTERLAGHGLRTTISVSLEALAAVDGGEAASAGTREPDAVS
jgi:signal transduction histidine kinase